MTRSLCATMRLQLLSSLAPPFGFPMASSRHCLGPVLDFSGTAFPGAGSSREGVGLGWMGRKQRSQSVRPILTSSLVVEPRPRHFPAVTTVDSLLPGTSGHNLVVKVVSSSVQVSKTRVDGTKITVAEVSRRPMAIFFPVATPPHSVLVPTHPCTNRSSSAMRLAASFFQREMVPISRQ
jgi:hypothetical protein